MRTNRHQLGDFLQSEAAGSLVDLDAWTREIEALGGWETVALEIAAARLLDPFWRRYSLGGSPGAALASAEVALRCPCPAHASEAYAASKRAEWTAEHPDLSIGHEGAGAPLPLWANAPASLAVAAARIAFDAAWAASKCSEPGDDPARFHGLAPNLARVLPRRCHERVRDYLRRALLPWALGSTEDLAEAEGAEALRQELLAAAFEEAAVAVDPAIVEARSEASRRLEVRARKVAAYAALLDMDVPRRGPESTSVGAFFGPSFHEACVVEITLEPDAEASLRVAGFDERLSDFLLDSIVGAAEVTPPAIEWCVRATIPRARVRLEAMDPWTIPDDDPDGGRDGISCYGRLLDPRRAPHGFLAWSPWYVGAKRHAEFFDRLLEVALGTLDDARARRALEGVDRHRRG